MPRALLTGPLLLLAAACAGGDAESVAAAGAAAVDELPAMRNDPPPFHYPSALYAQKVQGNVVLRLYVDSLGRTRPESTSVVESSGHPALDSAAVTGSWALEFAPARKNGLPRGMAILFPVYFRHPEAPPLPGDTILRRDSLPPSTP